MEVKILPGLSSTSGDLVSFSFVSDLPSTGMSLALEMSTCIPSINFMSKNIGSS